MGSIENLVDISKKFNDRIVKYFAPIFQHFELTHFWFHKINNNGFGSYFGANPDWIECFSENKYYLKFPLFRDPQILPSGFSFPNSLLRRSYLSDFEAVNSKYNFRNRVSITEKTEEGAEVYIFTTGTDNVEELPSLLNEHSLLRQFIRKFKGDNHAVISQLDGHQVDFKALLGDAFFRNDSMGNIESIKRQELLKKLNVKTPLSAREMGVLKYFLQGNSAAQIGKLLHLSKRTIEHHIERIKGKLLCDSKAGLIQKARELEGLGCLDF